MSSSETKSVIRRILVAVDGSENSARAVAVAAQIAKNNKAELMILHVVTIPLAAYSDDVIYPIGKLEGDARRAGEKFVADAASVAEQRGVKARTAIVEHVESPVRGITDYADKNAVDLIVVGTRGLGGFRRLLLGSVASGVVHYSRCSVVVVR